MRHRLAEELEDVVIVDGVVHESSGAAWTNEAHPSQEAELMGDGRLAHADERGDIADAKLSVRERIEDSHAGWITQDAKRVGKPFDRAGRQQALTSRGGRARIEVLGLTTGVDGRQLREDIVHSSAVQILQGVEHLHI
jgi:hypothetical protein